jgi:phosphoglycolate phosphatase-like HAD superfamily hydrolase
MQSASCAILIFDAILRACTAPNSIAAEDKADLIAYILAERGLEAGGCWMLGDRKHDVIAAKQHAIPIGAHWGCGREAELRDAGAAILCASPTQLLGRISGPRAPLKSRR